MIDYSNAILQPLSESLLRTKENGYTNFYLDWDEQLVNGLPYLRFLSISVSPVELCEIKPIYSKEKIEQKSKEYQKLMIEMNAQWESDCEFHNEICKNQEVVLFQISNLDDYEEYIYVPTNQYKKVLADIENKISHSFETLQDFLHSFEIAINYY